ncbi:hypothetical protein NHX12_012823 [Muraenolepis orangiensis]|uniref:Uncharacterized protein n=1 Tax=Muraenolepis orangiensis TaxID=630683 RepID=A0A9Q0DD70_9TELE|nr:hypothetical protein NHX12_012823 [Muraenolepis orangiensis]
MGRKARYKRLSGLVCLSALQRSSEKLQGEGNSCGVRPGEVLRLWLKNGRNTPSMALPLLENQSPPEPEFRYGDQKMISPRGNSSEENTR